MSVRVGHTKLNTYIAYETIRFFCLINRSLSICVKYSYTYRSLFIVVYLGFGLLILGRYLLGSYLNFFTENASITVIVERIIGFFYRKRSIIIQREKSSSLFDLFFFLLIIWHLNIIDYEYEIKQICPVRITYNLSNSLGRIKRFTIMF